MLLMISVWILGSRVLMLSFGWCLIIIEVDDGWILLDSGWCLGMIRVIWVCSMLLMLVSVCESFCDSVCMSWVCFLIGVDMKFLCLKILLRLL